MPLISSFNRTGTVLFRALPWLVFCLSLTTTLITSNSVQNHAEATLKEEFDFRVSEVKGKIKSRLEGYELVLRGTTALFQSSQEISRQKFRDYANALQLKQNYPGIQGVGFSELIPAQSRERHLSRIRAEGFLDYKLWPAGKREVYSAVTYIEPFDWRNRRAFGYDMYSEPLRHAAMAQARDENRATISGKVTLLQETDTEKQPGFLMYLPVYRADAAHDTPEQRRANLKGWVYAPFRMNDLMNGILGRHFDDISETLDLEIYDGDASTPQNLLYDIDKIPGVHTIQHHSQFVHTERLEIDGHHWTISLRTLPGFESRLKSERAQIINIAGTSISLLFAWVVWLLASGRARAIQLAQKMTLELQETNKQLMESEIYHHALLSNLPAAVVVHGPDTAIRYCNSFARKLLGLSEEQSMGRLAMDSNWHFLREDGSNLPEKEYPINRVLAEKSGIHGYVIGIAHDLKHDTSWVLVNAYPDLNGEGQITQVVISFIDISDLKRTEATLLKSYKTVQDLYHNAPCGYHSLDRDGLFLQINDTELSWLGYTREEIVGQVNFADILSPASASIFHENYPGFMERGWVRDLEFELLRKDGTVLPVLLSATAIRDDDGNYLMSRTTVFDITERKKAEHALQASERHTRQLLDNLPAGVVVHGPDCAVRYLNLKAQAFFKLNNEAAESKATTDFNFRFLREDGCDMTTHELPERQVLAERQPLKDFVIGVKLIQEQQPRWALVNAFPDFDDNGDIQQVIVSFVDITKRVLADAQLRNTRLELEHILNVNPAATYQIKVGNNSIFFRSTAIVDMAGYALADWQKPGFWISHIHPDDQGKVLLAQNRILECETLQHEYRFRHQDGRWIWILDRVNMVRDRDGKPLELVGVWLDITLRKQAEIGLENRNRFYSVLSRVNEAIIRATSQAQLFEDICRIAVEDGQFVMAWVGLLDHELHEITAVSHWGNEAGYLEYLRKVGILGFNGPTAQALHNGEYQLSDNIAADVAMSPWRQEALQRGYRSSAAFPIRLGDKVVGAINLYAAEAHYFNPDIINLLDDLALDISFSLGVFDQQERRAAAETQLQQLNQELEQRVEDRTRQLENANKELESFSYSVSHDLRAPLRSIDGFSEILEKTYADKLDDKGRDYFGRVRRASKRMGELIDDLLQLSRVTRAELHKEQVDLSAMVQTLSREIRETAPQRQSTWVIQDGVVMQADSSLIKVVLENLLGNAWKFTANQHPSRIEFGLLEQNNEKVVFVRDNGAGFDMQYAGKLFGAFQRLHKADEFEGTGIGLATVQRIIHRHGGRVWADSEIGRGTTLYFTLKSRTSKHIRI